MGYIRRIDTRIWGRRGFRKLSRPQPNSQDLFVSFIIGPLTGALPGLFVAGPATIAESMGWKVEPTKALLQELQDAGMLRRDDDCNLNFLTGAMEHNAPGSWQHLTKLGREFDGIPESDLKDQWIAELAAYCAAAEKVVPQTVIDLVPIEYRDDLQCRWDSYLSGRRKKEEGRRKKEEGRGEKDLENLTPPHPPEKLSKKAEKDRENSLIIASWIQSLLDSTSQRHVVERYVKEAMEGIEDYYEKRGGHFTIHRRAALASGMGKLSSQAQLTALEIYIDAFSGKFDYEYLLGIARNNHALTEDELDEKITKHRKQNKDGVFASV